MALAVTGGIEKMRAVLAVLAAMIAFEAILVIAFPQTVKKCVDALTPHELRIVGAIELVIAAVVVYCLLAGAGPHL